MPINCSLRSCLQLAAALAAAAAAGHCLRLLWWRLDDGGEAVNGIGHRRPFGNSRHPPLPVPALPGFPPPRRFFQEFVHPLRPLIMRAAIQHTRAFLHWNDDYFLSLQLRPEASMVNVETTKKERRDQRTYELPFAEFVRSYNGTGHYMVASMPAFLAPDFPLPWCLQCPAVEAALVEAIVWFSSGGTSSVVHTDAVDNVNCVVRGNKTFVLVDPAVHGHRVPIDVVEGAYSSIDVDSVDFRAYPGIADAQYHIAQLQPGDCLYIPYKWIHQVRSYGRNIAVNVWFDKSLLLPDAQQHNCSSSMRYDWLMDTARFKGFDYRQPLVVLLEAMQGQQAISWDSLLRFLLPDIDEYKSRFGTEFTEPLMQMFAKLDKNQNSMLEVAELQNLSQEILLEIDADFTKFDKMARSFQEELAAERNEL